MCIGGIAGLVLCLLAKLKKYLDDKKQGNIQQQVYSSYTCINIV